MSQQEQTLCVHYIKLSYECSLDTRVEKALHVCKCVWDILSFNKIISTLCTISKHCKEHRILCLKIKLLRSQLSIYLHCIAVVDLI